MKDKRVFALYKGDTWLMDGTIEEIAAARGCKPWSIYFLTTPVYKKRVRKREAARKKQSKGSLKMVYISGAKMHRRKRSVEKP